MGILIGAVNIFFTVLWLAVLARVLFSWIRPDPYNPLVRIIVLVTDPILQPLRRVIPPLGMIDITPMVALIGLSIIQQVVVGLLGGSR